MSFQRWINGSRKWQVENESYRISALKPKCKINVWKGIWLNGKNKLKMFNGNMNTDAYISILKENYNDMKKLGEKDFYIWEIMLLLI